MSLITYYDKCRLCNEPLDSFFNLGDHYLHGSFIFPDYVPPARKIDLNLCKCSNRNCGLVQLESSIDPSILYARYGYRSSLNQKMTKHLRGIVDDLLSIKFGSPRVLSIGGNDCYSLSCYPDYVKKVVVDPCDIANRANIPNLSIYNKSYPFPDCQDILGEFDIIEMIACFYDCNDPIGVATAIRKNLHAHGIAIIELSYWPDKMKMNAFDEICQEHVCFYSLHNLEAVFAKSGLKIIRATKNDINGGSIQLLLTHNSCQQFDRLEWQQGIHNIRLQEFEMELDIPAPYWNFVNNVGKLYDKVQNWYSTELIDNKKTAHLLAASTKGNVALQYFEIDSSLVPYCSERNPDKWGGKTLGTNIKMISEQESRAMNPDYYIVTNWSFKKEIIEREQEYLSRGGKLVFLIPDLQIISMYDGVVKEENP